MNQILNSQSILTGASPWDAGEFSVADKPVIIRAFGLGADDLICVKMVRKVQAGNPNVTASNCEITLPSGEVIAERQYLTDCGVKVCICAKQPWTVVSLSGSYQIEVSGSNIGNKLVTVEADIYLGSSLPNCAVMCKACEPAAVVPPPVTAAVTGLALPLPAAFLWQGQLYSAATFVAAVQSQVPGATYNGATGVFTAPAGSIFPPLATSAAPSAVIAGGAGQPACPLAFPVTYAGFAYSSLAALKAAIESDQSVTLSYNASACSFTQTGGNGRFANPNITPATVVSVTPCPTAFPMTWAVDGVQYANLSGFKTAFDAYYGVTSQYAATPACQLTILTGNVVPLPSAVLTPQVSQALAPCPVVFPAQWSGQVYANSNLFSQAVSQTIPGASYNALTCTITAPAGTVLPPAPSAAPTAPITGAACPLVFPLVYENSTVTNAAALDAAIEAKLGISVTVSAMAPCQVTQASGSVGMLPAAVVVSSPVVVPPCYLTRGEATLRNNSNGKIYTVVDCPPSQRAAYVAAGWVQINDNANNYMTLLSPTVQTVCGIEFAEPYRGNNNQIIGYLPY
jgi:hypothetical protein